MEPVHVKEALSLHDRVHLFAIQNEGDGRFQPAVEGVIKMVENITIRSKKQTSSFMLQWSSRVKSIRILNIACFLTLFVRECQHTLIEQRKR